MEPKINMAAGVLMSMLSIVWAETPDAHLGKGYDALRQERYDVAASELREALRLDPKLVMRARFPLGVALFELKETVAARKEFETVRKQTGDRPDVAYYLGRLDLIDQNFDAAIRNLTQASAKPPFPDTAYHLGFAYFKHGDLAAAEKWLGLAAQINPRDSVVEYQLAQVLRKKGHAEEAAKAMALSSELRRRDTDESQARRECAQKLEQGPRGQARVFCQRLYDPDSVDKLTALGTIYGQHGDLEDALPPLLRAAGLAPQSPQVQYNLAFTYCRLNRFEEARKPLADAVRRWPDLFPLNALYGAVLSKLGEYEESLRYFDQAQKLRPDDPEPHRGKAEVYKLTGRPEEAAAETRLAQK